MKDKIERIVIKLLEEENPGLLPDEAEQEAERVLYRKDLYEQAKWLLGKEDLFPSTDGINNLKEK